MGVVKEWSKSYKHVPRDSSSAPRLRQFVASFADDPCPPAMSLLIGWEYGRLWVKERDAFTANRAIRSKPKRIRNDYMWWLEKRRNATK